MAAKPKTPPFRDYTPLSSTFRDSPVRIARDYSKSHYVATYNPELGGIYLGVSKFAKAKNEQGEWRHGWRGKSAAFVVPHPKGLLYVVKDHEGYTKRRLIPGEIPFQRTVELLSEFADRFNVVDQIATEQSLATRDGEAVVAVALDDRNEQSASEMPSDGITLDADGIPLGTETRIRSEVFNDSLDRMLNTHLDRAAKRTRRAEVASALRRSGVWEKRGLLDPQKRVPKRFWSHFAGYLSRGDHRSLDMWWRSTLANRLLGKSESGEQSYNSTDKICAILNFEKITRVERSDDRAEYGQRLIAKRQNAAQLYFTTMRAVKAGIEAGYIPTAPWQIRHWERLQPQELLDAALTGLCHSPEWKTYTHLEPAVRALLSDTDYLRTLDCESAQDQTRAIHIINQCPKELQHQVVRVCRKRYITSGLRKVDLQDLVDYTNAQQRESVARSSSGVMPALNPNDFPVPPGWQIATPEQIRAYVKQCGYDHWSNRSYFSPFSLVYAKGDAIAAVGLGDDKWHVDDVKGEADLGALREMTIFARALDALHPAPETNARLNTAEYRNPMAVDEQRFKTVAFQIEQLKNRNRDGLHYELAPFVATCKTAQKANVR